MSAMLAHHHDAILGARLDPVKIAGASPPVSQAIGEALKIWAPTAVVNSVRFEPSCSTTLMSNSINARVYAMHKERGGEVVLQIYANEDGCDVPLATAGLQFPFSQE